MSATAEIEPVWRFASRIQPGWFVRMEGEWHEVKMTLAGGPIVAVHTVDGFVAPCSKSTEIATLTAREAKRYGLGGVE